MPQNKVRYCVPPPRAVDKQYDNYQGLRWMGCVLLLVTLHNALCLFQVLMSPTGLVRDSEKPLQSIHSVIVVDARCRQTDTQTDIWAEWLE